MRPSGRPACRRECIDVSGGVLLVCTVRGQHRYSRLVWPAPREMSSSSSWSLRSRSCAAWYKPCSSSRPEAYISESVGLPSSRLWEADTRQGRSSVLQGGGAGDADPDTTRTHVEMLLLPSHRQSLGLPLALQPWVEWDSQAESREIGCALAPSSQWGTHA